MAQNITLYAELDATSLGNFVKFSTRGITRACVQVTKITPSANDTTTFGVRHSMNGGFFVEYASAKTITPSAPTGSVSVLPIQVGSTEPFDINANWIDVYVKANAAANRWAIEVLDVDQVTPGGSIAEDGTRQVLVIGDNAYASSGGGASGDGGSSSTGAGGTGSA